MWHATHYWRNKKHVSFISHVSWLSETSVYFIFNMCSPPLWLVNPLCCSTWRLWAFSLWSSRGRHRVRRHTNWWMHWRTRTSCTGSTVCRSWSRSAWLRLHPYGGCTARGQTLFSLLMTVDCMPAHNLLLTHIKSTPLNVSCLYAWINILDSWTFQI